MNSCSKPRTRARLNSDLRSFERALLERSMNYTKVRRKFVILNVNLVDRLFDFESGDEMNVNTGTAGGPPATSALARVVLRLRSPSYALGECCALACRPAACAPRLRLAESRTILR
jgi:hypothetical protein